MKTLYVVTHPQSIHHVEDRVGGWYDTGLTDLGRRQADAIAARIAELCAGKTPSLVSSDLLRCSETAEIIGRSLGLKPCLTPGLREMSYGVAEGKPQAWLDSRRLPVPDEGSLDDTGGIDGAETRREMGTRIYDAMDALQADPPDTLVMVTHGFALTFIIAWWIGMPIDCLGRVSFPVPSGSITHLAENTQWKSRAVVTLGERDHLIAIP
ncbi:fructose-2,6-bisphosphatase [Agrobacterium albertimagni AOL15]|uniref:Fructose-2,6-bisphosphatase n=1 Tax=Agrobacterium albertimagni AOL15 TaxID=1156935 RepID=K2PAU9_9HYPH|nr:histidine phosphatase family protein [Agrobacterium albertimagni]EKF58018.1 fructose-2,6-bisphosphatase [Agrobacterium albertimagni AOL15]